MPQNARLPFYGFSNFLSDFKGEINKIKWAKIYN
jgi:preprotein translocase subunit SecE